MRLTEQLLSYPQTKAAHQRATQHPFLRTAGDLSLSKDALERWLTQDRLYALCGYSVFLGALIAKLPTPEAGPENGQSKLHRKRLTVLAGAMANIDREVGFFEDIARENGLSLSRSSSSVSSSDDEPSTALANAITRGYIDYMVATAFRGTFEEGLILLWAMEKLYLDSWTYAATFTPTQPEKLPPGTQRALRSLIPNWCAPGFVKFVDDIADLVDDLDIDIHSTSNIAAQVLAVWTTTLWFEERFWRAGSAVQM